RVPCLSKRSSAPPNINAHFLRPIRNRRTGCPMADPRICERRHPDQPVPRSEGDDSGGAMDREVSCCERATPPESKPGIPPKIRRSLLPRLAAAHGTSVRPLADPGPGGGSDVPRIPTADSHPRRSATHCDTRGIRRRTHRLQNGTSRPLDWESTAVPPRGTHPLSLTPSFPRGAQSEAKTHTR